MRSFGADMAIRAEEAEREIAALRVRVAYLEAELDRWRAAACSEGPAAAAAAIVRSKETWAVPGPCWTSSTEGR